MEIQKLQSLSRMEDNISRQQNSHQVNQEGMENKAKERELDIERKKVEEIRYQLDQREKSLQHEEDNFQSYRRREEDRLQVERRSLIEKESEIRKTELERRR